MGDMPCGLFSQYLYWLFTMAQLNPIAAHTSLAKPCSILLHPMCACFRVFVCLLPLPRVINGVDLSAYIFYVRKRRALSSFWLISSSSDTTSKGYSSQDENQNNQIIVGASLCSSCTYCFFYYFLQTVSEFLATDPETRVRFPALPGKKSSGSGTGSTQPREYNWAATW
jgi:hypothetical protein